jgi:hypothetical protein
MMLEPEIPSVVEGPEREKRKIESPRNRFPIAGATCDAGLISRILYGVTAVTVIPLGRSSLNGSSDLPESLAHRAGTHGFFPRVPQTACACFALAPGSSRTALTAAHPAHRHSFPIWSCSVWGLPCPVHYCPGGALLPHLFTLTSGLRLGRYILCGTFRRMALKPSSRTLSGTLLSGVRTFLSPGRAAREFPAFTTRTATIRSNLNPHIIR